MRIQEPMRTPRTYEDPGPQEDLEFNRNNNKIEITTEQDTITLGWDRKSTSAGFLSTFNDMNKNYEFTVVNKAKI